MCGVNITPSFSLIFGSRFLESWKLGFSKPLLDLQNTAVQTGSHWIKKSKSRFFSKKKHWCKLISTTTQFFSTRKGLPGQIRRLFQRYRYLLGCFLQIFRIESRNLRKMSWWWILECYQGFQRRFHHISRSIRGADPLVVRVVIRGGQTRWLGRQTHQKGWGDWYPRGVMPSKTRNPWGSQVFSESCHTCWWLKFH